MRLCIALALWAGVGLWRSTWLEGVSSSASIDFLEERRKRKKKLGVARGVVGGGWNRFF